MHVSDLPVLVLDFALGAVGLYLVARVCRSNKYPTPLPPGPKGSILFGNLKDLPAPGEPEWIHWAKHKAKYGPLSYLRVLGQDMMIISDYKIAFDLFEKRGAMYSERPVQQFGGEMIGWKSGVLSMQYTDGLRACRKSIRQIIGTNNAILRLESLQEVEARKFLLRVLEEPESEKLRTHIRTEAGAIILKVAYGYSIEPRGPDPLIELAEEAMSQFSEAVSPGKWLVDVIPALRFLPGWLPGMGFKAIAKEWKECLREFTEKPYAFVKAQMKSDATDHSSFVSEHLKKGVDSAERELVIKNSAMSIYAAGSDTTVSSIYCFFLTMMLFPDIQKKAQEEIDMVVGSDRLPSFEDRTSLPYVDAIVKEIFRWHPILPTLFPHVSSRDDVYNGMFIPKGTLLIPNVWLFLHDETNYKEPALFNPERFLGQEPEMDPRTMCFGFGRRICVGRELADKSVFLTIAMVLAAFNIRKPTGVDGSPIEPTPKFTTGVISKPYDFECDVKPRSTKAEQLIRSVEDYPWEESDAAKLAEVKWDTGVDKR